MPSVNTWLSDATLQLSKKDISSASLDAEVILADTLDRGRTYLHAHCNDFLSLKDKINADSKLEKRLNRVPVAYIVGYKEFYGRKFKVTKDTLIPRPESEGIIEILKQVMSSISHLPFSNYQLIDVGTGNGCLGITTKLEFPQLNVALSDISSQSLKIARLNAKQLLADVEIVQSDLLDNFFGVPNIITANLPYVDKAWKRSPETDYEPSKALFANNHGLAVNKKLIAQSSKRLLNNGYIVIEADPTQHATLIQYANKYLFELIHQIDYVIAFKLNKQLCQSKYTVKRK